MNDIGRDEIAQALENFVRENFHVDSDDDFFSRTVNLWEEGYVDSVGVIEMMGHLESTYGVQIPKTMLFDSEFTSVAGISEGIARLIGDET